MGEPGQGSARLQYYALDSLPQPPGEPVPATGTTRGSEHAQRRGEVVMPRHRRQIF